MKLNRTREEWDGIDVGGIGPDAAADYLDDALDDVAALHAELDSLRAQLAERDGRIASLEVAVKRWVPTTEVASGMMIIQNPAPNASPVRVPSGRFARFHAAEGEG